ncbi:PREDICTED: lymphokine-activated killer T-cell-originated protein kinase [Nicrophorus vespilloides]|uniref:Lymphokine-activated killer T-cell-originated protein kinase n=1 Tax=Nicrophorus vespilloides TaxID=110193 RepID=A0ABM1MZP6_NICVS|nr:PREDICTED: lymphokine-activated killer T-cell-originated protein kinase [Nicrophorus vespilloides]
MDENVTPIKKIIADKRKLLKLSIPPSPMMTKLGFGTGVIVYKMERSPVKHTAQSPWALKKVTKKDNPELNCRLKKEAALLRRLSHPNIVGYRGFVDTSSGYNYLAMEECSTSLGDLIEIRRDDDMGPFCSSNIWKVATDISNALNYLHNDVQILHADLKSYNVLVKGDFEICKLCDFGVSLELLPDGSLDDSKLEKDFEFPGTLSWSAPEVLGLDQIVTSKVDIYAFGLILWEAMSLEVPVLDESNDVSSFGELDSSQESSILDTSYIVRQRPNLPDYEFGKDYNVIIEMFYFCTEVDFQKRPNATQLCAIIKDSERGN